MDTITVYRSAADLKRKIIDAYLLEVKKNAKSAERILADKSWAAADIPYHRLCRLKMQNQIAEYDKQIELLTEK